ncbi:hypothetical protein ACGFY3_13155 [Streptomyces mirabilis]|uniref:hypothetical protein n=1 Tax=Streptomyces mirabilis TaxID=68239 RepID=UPI00371E42E9
MGVTDSQWWALWWEWVVVWLLTVVCCAVLLRYALVRLGRLRLRRRRGGGRTVLGMCFYLHEERVRDLILSGGFAVPVEQEVADRTHSTTGFGLLGKLGFGGGRFQRDVTRESVTTYVRQNTPITVIRLLMDTMRKEDVVVDADLTTGRLVLNRALAESLRDGPEPGKAPLSAVMSEFVSVTGRFTAHRTDSGDVVLRARYGSGEPSAHVKITCAGSEGRGEFRNEDYYTGEFQARCLGKVRTWISGTGELTLDPIAIFR